MDLTTIFVQIINGLDEQDPTANKKRKKKRTGSLKQVVAAATSNKKKLARSAFGKQLDEMLASMTYMRDYLISIKHDYLNIGSILSIASKMTDQQRDEIDRDVQDFIKMCYDMIRIIKVQSKFYHLSKHNLNCNLFLAKSKAGQGQIYEHECQAIALVEGYVKALQDLHTKQKTLRLKRNLEAQKFFNLGKSLVDGISSGMTRAKSNESILSSGGGNSSDASSTAASERKPKKETKEKLNKSPETKTTSTTAFYDEEQISGETSINGHTFSVAEVQKYMTEGNQIYSNINSMNDEVGKIAGKLVEISHLQEMFSENVLKQDEDLQRVSTATITTTEDIREGNEHLRKAMRNNAGFRVWILFFITTLSFVILFLDWYNP